MTTPAQTDLVNVFDAVRNIVGVDNFIEDLAEREYFSQDYYKKAEPVAAVTRYKPTTV